jgi:ABC-type Mn2+/Zn2+ transport system permease subunit
VSIVFSAIAILLTKIIYKKLVLGMISEDLAASKGINIGRINLLYLLLVSLIVAIGIRITGTLLVGFLVIVPAAAAKNASNNLRKYGILSALFGAISTCSGILLSNSINLGTVEEIALYVGPLIVFSGISIFLATAILKGRSKG